MRKRISLFVGIAASPMSVVGLVQAQTMPQPPGGATPPVAVMAPASKNPAAAAAGTYRLDLEHSSVVARVPHRGMSFNVLRFGVREGMLRWNPAKPSAITLDVTVDTKPHYAPIVYNILPEGEQSLNVAKFPQARFVSTGIRLKGARQAAIEGWLTLRGVTEPVVINAELVGVGKSMEGAPTVGFTGSMVVNWGDFNDQQMARMIGKVTVILDAEFIKS